MNKYIGIIINTLHRHMCMRASQNECRYRNEYCMAMYIHMVLLTVFVRLHPSIAHVACKQGGQQDDDYYDKSAHRSDNDVDKSFICANKNNECTQRVVFHCLIS